MVNVEQIARALHGARRSRIPLGSFMKRAAVAAIARDGAEGAELLFIVRAERDGDPWSGHVAFPGGRLEPADASEQAAAERETHEEIGLDLRAAGRYLGALDEVMAKAHGKPLPMVIHPFVYALERPPGDLVLSDEVQAVLWIPVAFLRERANRGTLTWRIAGLPVELPCYRYQGQTLWGLTLKMVDELLGLVAPTPP